MQRRSLSWRKTPAPTRQIGININYLTFLNIARLIVATTMLSPRSQIVACSIPFKLKRSLTGPKSAHQSINTSTHPHLSASSSKHHQSPPISPMVCSITLQRQSEPPHDGPQLRLSINKSNLRWISSTTGVRPGALRPPIPQTSNTSFAAQPSLPPTCSPNRPHTAPLRHLNLRLHERFDGR